MEMNEILKKLPRHLLDFVIDQPYNEYTSQDHAVWRYVMRRNVDYLKNVAHQSYLGGLERTGISIDSIPHMYGMNRILKDIGWAAVAVDGFIPPAAFMEFQAYNVLVIAADIRPIDQIEYTPAPDIIHEAAGHAPIIADPEYAEYLREFGEIGSKAFSSSQDYKIYEAIRHLSILKANPYSKKKDIDLATENLDKLAGEAGPPSEMTLIRNLHWWTVEYGLIGELNKPKIYGAGLLSSIGESYNAMQDSVKKIPYTIDAKDYSFDITTQQPQLFVTPDFKHLTHVLNDFAGQMALRRGGLEGILKAVESGKTASCELSSGLQVSGTYTDVKSNGPEVIYFRTTGPTQLSYRNEQLRDHAKEYHKDGYGSPVGNLKTTDTPLQFLTEGELAFLGIIPGESVKLEFESGVLVRGRLNNILRSDGKNILMTFEECTVSFKHEILFDPSWGIYDMAVGEKIIAAYNGPADPDAFQLSYRIPEEKTHKIVHTQKAVELHKLYRQVRDIREGRKDFKTLPALWEKLMEDHADEWLLPMEILELTKDYPDKVCLNGSIKDHLMNRSQDDPGLANVIGNGLKLINTSS